LLGEVLISHDVINEIVGQIPNIWDKMKKPLHGKKKRSMQRGNVKKQLHVTCNVGKGTWQLSIIWHKWNESFIEES
jgi:hypothetical protein